MPRNPVCWALDSSVLIPHLRVGRYRRFLYAGLARRTVFLPGVVLCEVMAGTRSPRDRADLEALRRAFGIRILDVDTRQWALAGRCLADYAARWGRIRPRDHLPDVLVAVAAVEIGAVLGSENLDDMRRWASILKKLGFRLEVQRPDDDE